MSIPTVLKGESNSYKYDSIDEDWIKESVAVVREHQKNVDILRDNLFKVEEKLVITILNSKGDRFINYQQTYDDETSIKHLEATILDKNGYEIERFNKKDFQDFNLGGSGVSITDTRLKVLEYQPTDYPITVEFYSEVQSKNTGFLPSWDLAYGYNVGIESSILQVVNSTGIKLNEELKPGYLDIPIRTERFTDKIIYSAEGIPPVKYEDLAPKLKILMPKLILGIEEFYLHNHKGYAKDWVSFGKWYFDQFLNRNFELQGDVIEYVKQLTQDLESPFEKAKKIYEYVQSRTRYISVQLGIGGWKPSPAAEVHEFGYGDCKGLTHYTRALLKAVDIPAHVAIVNAGIEKRDLSENLTSMQGNHVVLALPMGRDTCWMECTSQTSPLGYIGQFTDDRKVLLVTGEGGSIISTKKYDHDDNTQVSNIDMEIMLDGSLSADISVENTGLFYDRSHLYLNNKKDEIEEYFLTQYQHINRLEFSKVDSDINKDSIILRESFEAHVPNYTTITGKDMLFSMFPFIDKQQRLNKYNNRTLPFYIRNGETKVDQGKIIIPKGYIVDAQPESITIDSDQGVYKLDLSVQENTIYYRRELTIYDGLYKPGQYSSYRKFLKKVIRQDRAKVSISKQS